MFTPPPFRVDDKTALDMAAAVGFGHLVAVDDGAPVSTPMPFLLDDERRRLVGHLARGNPFVQLTNRPALMIVPGTDGYISPSGYPSKREHGRVVPTWNYEVVHLHGSLTIVDDATRVRDIVARLTGHHEGTRHEPWSIDDAPTGYIGKLTSAIVGVELTIERVVGKRKLSQNTPDADRDGAIALLRDDGQTALADTMQQSV